MNFTLNNHLKYWIGDRLFGTREWSHEPFTVSVGKIDKDYFRTSNWLNEQYRTATLIKEDFGKDFVVMFSGGTDSEIVLRIFKHLNIKHRTVFIKFKNDYNLHDLKYAVDITTELDIPLEIVDFDVVDFYNSGSAYEFAKKIQCRQIAYLTVLEQIRKMSMPAIMGGEMLMRRFANKHFTKWFYCFRENEDASAMRFSLTYNIPLVNEWFSYTPEMLAYYILDDDVQRLITDKNNGKLSSISSKNKILKKYVPSIIEKTKTHGYEQLIGFNEETYQSLALTHVKRLEASLDGIFMQSFYDQLGIEKLYECS